MTNKFYNDTATLSVYIANLDEYVKGNLVGDWISLPIKKRDFRDFLFTIGNPEKVKILDYIDSLGLDGLKIRKYKSLKEVNQLAKRMKNIDPSEVNTFNALYEASGNFNSALECLEFKKYGFYGAMIVDYMDR